MALAVIVFGLQCWFSAGELAVKGLFVAPGGVLRVIAASAAAGGQNGNSSVWIGGGVFPAAASWRMLSAGRFDRLRDYGR